MNELSKHLEELSPSKRALFETLIKEKQTAKESSPVAPALPLIVPDLEGRYQPFPLTDMQQAYWVGRSVALQGGNVATHIYEELESTDIDLERLNRAWQRLIERHDMLRAIVQPDGQQRILQDVPRYSIAVTDVSERRPDEVESHLAKVRARMSHQSLPSDQWPLFELHATRLAYNHYRIHISIDGLMLDGWSYQRLFHEWFSLYEDPNLRLPPFEISFRDYVLAELSLRESEAYKSALAYWESRLETLPPAPQLPLAQAPELLAEPRFVRRKARLEAEAWNRLKERAAQAGLSANGLLLAVYAEVLTVWSKKPHFTLNVPRFNRVPLHPQVNELLGEFASFTLLEVDNTAAEPFEIRARRIQEQLWRDLNYQQVSGVRVLRELNQLRKRSSETLMPIVFTSLPHAVDAKQAPVSFPLADKAVYGVTQTSQVWLDYQGSEDAGALLFNWDSVDDLFPPGLIEDMFGSFCAFLQRLAEDERAWREIRPQLIPGHQLEKRAEINSVEAAIPPELLHTLFAAQASERPQHPAIISEGQVLTYEELARRVNRLGRHLRRLGVRPNTLVAVVMEKGWEQVVAVLGALAAGGAYLPIDPSLPPERLHYLLKDGEVAVALTQSELNERTEWPEQVRRICVDREEQEIESGDEPLEPVQTPDDLAYVIYTSGSTGLPKGVMIAHRGVVNAINETNRRFAVDPTDRVLALTALHHDMSVYDIFGTLAAGGTIVMPSASATRDPAAWLKLMSEEQVTIWNSVPALMEMLVEYTTGQFGSLSSSLRLVFMGGDWIPVTLPSRIRALSDSEEVQIVSVGGPTETTLWNIWYIIERADPTWKSIPYGTPIANTRYYVLNELGEHCPVWVPGVLHCAGVGVAKGYWRDEEKTRASFQHHAGFNERLYRTGDLGRFLPDGTIEFLGREDYQVKLQGMRIELGEIEAALMKHPRVRTAVVTLNGTSQGNKQLTAHLVLEEQASPTDPAGMGLFLEEDDPQRTDEVLLSKAERIEFKLKEHGLRRFEATQPAVELAQPAANESLLEAYAARRSYRTYQPTPIPFSAFSEFLGCLRQIQFDGLPMPKYLYPSSGGLYPVQVYVYVKPDRIEKLPAGTYYYSPKEHRLVLLDEDVEVNRDIHVSINRTIFDESAFSIFLIADMDAITPMYGALARDFCLLEAGYIGQTLSQAAPPAQIGLCPVGSLDFEQLRNSFKLEANHAFLHSLLGGAIEPEQIKPSGLLREVSSLSSTAQAPVGAEKQQTIRQELQSFLQQKLPKHMIPVSFEVRESLPLTANGKIDRKALAEGVGEISLAEESYTPPRTEIERMIADAWRAVLPTERIGIHDNFFELNGNSVQLVQIHAILEKTFNREFSVVDLFQYPTIASLAEMLDATQEGAQPVIDETYQRAEMRGKSRRQSRRKRRDAGEQEGSE
jgi:amino acid adenylation domain-containing protein